MTSIKGKKRKVDVDDKLRLLDIPLECFLLSSHPVLLLLMCVVCASHRDCFVGQRCLLFVILQSHWWSPSSQKSSWLDMLRETKMEDKKCPREHSPESNKKGSSQHFTVQACLKWRCRARPACFLVPGLQRLLRKSCKNFVGPCLHTTPHKLILHVQAKFVEGSVTSSQPLRAKVEYVLRTLLCVRTLTRSRSFCAEQWNNRTQSSTAPTPFSN